MPDTLKVVNQRELKRNNYLTSNHQVLRLHKKIQKVELFFTWNKILIVFSISSLNFTLMGTKEIGAILSILAICCPCKGSTAPQVHSHRNVPSGKHGQQDSTFRCFLILSYLLPENCNSFFTSERFFLSERAHKSSIGRAFFYSQGMILTACYSLKFFS